MTIPVQTLKNNLVFNISDETGIDLESLSSSVLFTSEEMKQVEYDFDNLSDQELADKYPDITREWIPDENLSLFKKKLVYLLEQSIAYFDIGGFSPDGNGPMVKSDLRFHHLPNSVESTILTLRSDIVPTGNRPANDLESPEPYIWAWENDDDEWKKINIRRVHHMFDMQLRKWHPNQHWLLDKLSRWTATIKYYDRLEDAEAHHPLYTSNPLDIRTKTTTVTLDPKLMPQAPEQEVAQEEPLNAKWDLYNKINLWDVENEQWISICSFQILDMDVLEDKVPPPPPDDGQDHSLKPKNKKPSNWRQLRDGIDKIPQYD